MASIPPSSPLYPDVPASAGVPPVQRDAGNSSAPTTPQLTQDSVDVSQVANTQWGVYAQGGALALDPDNIIALSYSAEYRIADFPIEQGGFETYDKVALPFDTIVRMTKGGTLSDRGSFARTAESLRGDTKLYNVVTPEATYLNVNIARLSIDRSQDGGAGMIVLELHLREIRQNAKAAFSATKDPASAATTNNGSTQTSSALEQEGMIQ